MAEELLTSVPGAGSLGDVEEVIVIRDSDPDSAVAGDGTLPPRPYTEFKGRGSREPSGDPKVVSYTDRGAYLNSLGEVIHSGHSSSSVYLWTLPMFHCNGWCTAWGVTAVGGTPERVRVVDPDMNDVPPDGGTMGETVMRGNGVMKGYFRDQAASELAFAGGWFHSGDLGVMHPNGYVELMDRAKDIVISGGENISTVEVERTLLSHPAVVDVAVIGVPDERWGERPKAFVVLGPGQTAGEHELIDHVRSRIAHHKAPDAIEFLAALRRNSTGKIHKHELRALESTERSDVVIG